MESTATYWKPVFYGLEDRMECWLLNAAHMKAVPGRKTDVRDAEWIAQLIEHGLVRPSFVPPPSIRRLRNLTRYRVQLMGDRTRHAGRLEKLLEDAWIKLSRWRRTSPGPSSRAMLAALVAGERDAAVMADLAHSALRRKIPDLTEALTGRFDDHHALLVGQMLRRAGPGRRRRWAASTRRSRRRWRRGRDELDLLRTIPGVGPVLRRCSSPRPAGTCPGSAVRRSTLAAWVGVAPAMHESAGKRTPAGSRHGNKLLTSMLVEARALRCAVTKNTYLAAQYARLASRRGGKRAAVAVAHSMLVSAYWMLGP